MHAIGMLIARILIAQHFIIMGLNRITNYDVATGEVEALGIPGMLAPVIILLELGAGVLLIVGWTTRVAAALLALLTVLIALVLPATITEPAEWLRLTTELALLGGLTLLALTGPGRLSFDRWRG